ncbi:phospho-N-acetylmuramoyl-pentapeptide-transferase [Clostridium sp. 'deep sea']|uniref:phospho-N-acetylmuramoyl-pentapeptide- transferase n=1 Tax=Clostridium sp. 'deep sea' TaxID=2779445 RepID=UPI00189672DA|nr:phospho-N-acetylmuramoyl-pentapeptide-transferase [Clostridium sp. 'deep sea']QOR36220.1 phospho-N-acetylmuramoyl-pentapeptide-transferase [Clostridium sp. 'deep sea']
MIREFLLYGGAALLIALITGPFIIKALKRLKAGATIQEELSKEHQVKVGTPLMGGIIFVIPVTVMSLILWYKGLIDWRSVLAFLVFFLGYGFIGFMDDYLKVVKKHSDGLNIKQKLVGQCAIFLVYLLIFYGQQIDTSLAIPFTHWKLSIGYAYIPFLLLFVVGFSNAVNFTDGMDGLLSGCMIASCWSYVFISIIAGNTGLAIIAAIIIGSLLGYLRYNYHPARVFMGDTGSLALGGALTALAILTKTELLLVVVGAVYVIEMLSVVMQISYFKITKGKRIFKMAPIHHHFSLLKWEELKVVWSFWLASALFGLLGLLGYINTI